MWTLYLKYEDFLKLNDPIEPEIELGNEESKTLENCPMAVIESAEKLHLFKANIQFKQNREVPSSPQLNINTNLTFPPGIDPNQIPEQAEEILRDLMSQISQQIPQMVQQEITNQSPVTGFGGRVYGGKWHAEK